VASPASRGSARHGADGCQHFLEEHQVGSGGAYRIAQFREDEAPVEKGETLVGIHRENLDGVHG
jgi:hypothetical protein